MVRCKLHIHLFSIFVLKLNWCVEIILKKNANETKKRTWRCVGNHGLMDIFLRKIVIISNKHQIHYIGMLPINKVILICPATRTSMLVSSIITLTSRDARVAGHITITQIHNLKELSYLPLQILFKAKRVVRLIFSKRNIFKMRWFPEASSR